MEIILENIAKKYNSQWIFRNVNLKFSQGQIYAITGPNGSGKSTFLSIISGFSLPSLGKVIYKNQNQIIPEEKHYEQVSIAAPYLELIEEFTLNELLDFHFKFISIIDNESKKSLLAYIGLEQEANKPVKFFSSGMKQRVKLGLAFFTNKFNILLDEPTVNLDAEGCQLYQSIVKEKLGGRLLIISSNVAEEYNFTENIIAIKHFNSQ